MRQITKKILFSILMIGFIFSQEKVPDDIMNLGRKIYIQSCAVCHGLSGKGDGVVAGNLLVKPRDFTSGKYKLRSTKPGQVPLDQDIYKTLGRGMGHDNSMPAWSSMRVEEKHAVIAYIKAFAPKKFKRQNRVKIVNIPPRKATSRESIAAGRQWFMDIECSKCHGANAHADGPSTADLKDSWGYKIVPPDLSKPWLYIGGSKPEDIYRTLSTGLTGSAMPALDGVLTEDQTWDLVNFLLHEYIEPGNHAPR